MAVAAALTVPALAYAEATVYGQFNPSIDIVKNGVVAPGDTSNNQLNSGGSRVGVKGSEDLGSGMSVVWMLEAGVNVSDGETGGGQFFNRESNIDLSSDSMGTVLLGLQASPYKAVTRRLDVFGDSAADNRAVLSRFHDQGGTAATESVKNAVSYKTPSMGGFTLRAATVFGAENPVAGANDGSAIGLAAQYEDGPIYVALAIDNAKFGDTGTGGLAAPTGNAGPVDDKDEATMLGGSYTMDAFTVNAQIEQLKYTAAATSTDTKNTNFYLSGTLAVTDAGTVKLAYTDIGEQEVAGVDQINGGSQVAVGYDHGMSKNTSVYALYTKISNDPSGTNGTTVSGADPSTVSFGLKHAF